LYDMEDWWEKKLFYLYFHSTFILFVPFSTLIIRGKNSMKTIFMEQPWAPTVPAYTASYVHNLGPS
jgi:hypothetical protein